MTAKKNTDLNEFRKKIDAIDDQFLSLLKKRLNYAKQIGNIKAKNNKAKWDPQREREILARLKLANADEFPEQPLISIFHEICDCLNNRQRRSEFMR